MEYIAFDSYKHCTFVQVEDAGGKLMQEQRIEHYREAFREFLSGCEVGSSVAIETIGNWYWIVDGIDAAGMTPNRLTLG